mmetsp:Transcript_77215/g.221157  ORF Transcript_77215/g.221157 Transcript_77215/m.221157 type:complete len:253 (+) Transcript_77215:2858-3616(+)
MLPSPTTSVVDSSCVSSCGRGSSIASLAPRNFANCDDRNHCPSKSAAQPIITMRKTAAGNAKFTETPWASKPTTSVGTPGSNNQAHTGNAKPAGAPTTRWSAQRMASHEPESSWMVSARRGITIQIATCCPTSGEKLPCWVMSSFTRVALLDKNIVATTTSKQAPNQRSWRCDLARDIPITKAGRCERNESQANGLKRGSDAKAPMTMPTSCRAHPTKNSNPGAKRNHFSNTVRASKQQSNCAATPAPEWAK